MLAGVGSREQRLLSDLRDAMEDATHAYLVRTRTERMVRRLRNVRGSDEGRLKELLDAAMESSRQMARFSETLDSRWEWRAQELSNILDEVETLLR